MGNASPIPFITVEPKGDRDAGVVPQAPVGEEPGNVPELIVESVIPPNPAVSARAALVGYGGSGRSPADAT